MSDMASARDRLYQERKNFLIAQSTFCTSLDSCFFKYDAAEQCKDGEKHDIVSFADDDQIDIVKKRLEAEKENIFLWAMSKSARRRYMNELGKDGQIMLWNKLKDHSWECYQLFTNPEARKAIEVDVLDEPESFDWGTFGAFLTGGIISVAIGAGMMIAALLTASSLLFFFMLCPVPIGIVVVGISLALMPHYWYFFRNPKRDDIKHIRSTPEWQEKARQRGEAAQQSEALDGDTRQKSRPGTAVRTSDEEYSLSDFGSDSDSGKEVQILDPKRNSPDDLGSDFDHDL